MLSLIPVLGALDPVALLRALPGSVSQGLIWGIMSIGVYITFKILDFADLTVDGTLATGGAVTAMMILNGYSPVVSLVVAFIAGMAAGFITGVLHTVFGIPDILAGILTQIALYSVNLNITGGKANQAISVDQFPLIVTLREISHTILVTAIITIAVIAVLYWFFGTEMGFTIRATGCNPNMSRAQGINTSVAKVIALVFSNGLVGFAGGILAQYQGNCDVNMGRGSIVIGLASVIIGEVLGEALFGKKLNFCGRLLFVAIGSIIYYIVISFVCWLGLPSIDMKLFSAIVVAVFLAVPYMRGKMKNSYRKAAKGGSKAC
ncbi:ABC transporter permease [Jutongia hominis]|jgi:putative ABC transport system permease protein|uniref:ABC transporter permease n=1 Tax=Jutongia hominis TaxID=2763664 RepID=A0ABR7MX86_9FIRM|nr:ABC transporter permease [Jutongia hominis]MBC8558373.1 ABC transporter permease [Jutongia hominis]